MIANSAAAPANEYSLPATLTKVSIIGTIVARNTINFAAYMGLIGTATALLMDWSPSISENDVAYNKLTDVANGNVPPNWKCDPEKYCELLKKAHQKYKGAGSIENHHEWSIYSGGPESGYTIPLDKAYHAMITQEIRNRLPYPGSLHRGDWVKIWRELDEVYGEFPLCPIGTPCN